MFVSSFLSSGKRASKTQEVSPSLDTLLATSNDVFDDGQALNDSNRQQRIDDLYNDE
jgi:hypothetical protein